MQSVASQGCTLHPVKKKVTLEHDSLESCLYDLENVFSESLTFHYLVCILTALF